MTLQALRETVGDKAFFATLRTWAQSKRGTSGTTAEFTALAERVSGKNLDTLFMKWLTTKEKPTSPP
jgi:aminopeptidase N